MYPVDAKVVFTRKLKNWSFLLIIFLFTLNSFKIIAQSTLQSEKHVEQSYWPKWSVLEFADDFSTDHTSSAIRWRLLLLFFRCSIVLALSQIGSTPIFVAFGLFLQVTDSSKHRYLLYNHSVLLLLFQCRHAYISHRSCAMFGVTIRLAT